MIEEKVDRGLALRTGTALNSIFRVAIGILIFAALLSTAQAGDWTMFRHDLEHTGVADEAVEPPLKLLWKYTTEYAIITGWRLTSSPAISDGVVYVGSSDKKVYALDAATGANKWSYKTGGVVHSSPAVSGGIVYVGSDDDNIYALDAATGALKWNRTIFSRSSPTVSGGIVYVGSSGGSVIALDAATGALKWHYYTGNYFQVDSSPAISDGTIYVVGWYLAKVYAIGTVYALDAATGTLKWNYTTSNGIPMNSVSSPAVSGGIVYVGSGDRNVYALDAATGALKWKYATGGSVDSSPAVSGGVVYVGSDDLYALDATTGILKWKSTGYYSSPAISGGVVYVSSYDNLSAFDAATGKLKWKYTVGLPKGYVGPSSPAISGGKVYVGFGGNVYAFASITTPSSPQNLQANTGDAFVNLNWNAPINDGNSAITNYRIYRGTTPGGETLLWTIGNRLSYNDTSVTNGQTYYYMVSAVNAAGEGAMSSEVSATPHKITYSYTIQTTNNAMQITADGIPQNSPYTTTWVDGTIHSISVPSPQEIVPGQSQYVFTSWSGMSTSTSPSISITAGASTEGTYTANYKTQHYLTVNTEPAGLTPISGSGWYDSGVTAATGTAPALVGANMFSTWKVDGSPVSGNPIPVSMNAPHTATAVYDLDNIPPATTATISGSTGNNGWNTSDVKIALSAIDNLGGSGVKKTEYSFDNVGWNTYTAQFTISDEGTKNVYYRSIDNAGNTEAAKTGTVKIDKTAPEISGSPTTSPNSNGWYNRSVVVHFSVSDAISGIDSVTPDITLSENASSQSVTGTVIDRAGNSNSTSVSGINIDMISPGTNISLSGTSGNNGWYVSKNVTIILIPTESGSGIAKIETSSNGINWNIYTAPFNITMQGETKVYYRSIDNAGNAEDPKNQTVKIDWIRPNLNTNPVVRNATNSSGAVVDYIAQRNVTASDSNSGLLSLTCIPPPGLFPLGTTAVNCIAEDVAGNNVSGSFNVTIKDGTPPNTSILTVVDGNGMNIMNDTLNTTVNFTFSGIDYIGSDIVLDPLNFKCRHFENQIPFGIFKPCTSPWNYFNLTTGVFHTIEVYAIDNSGNRDLSPANFTWFILTPVQGGQALVDIIENMNLPAGETTSLTATVKESISLLADSNPTNDVAVCGKMTSLIEKVDAREKTHRLTALQARQIRLPAKDIKISVGCQSSGRP